MPKKLSQSFKFASDGIRHAFSTQRDIKIHVFSSLVVLIAGIIMGLAVCEMVVLILAVSIVFLSQLMKTAIDEIADLVIQEKRVAATIAENVAGGAVLFSGLCAIAVICLIFIPHIFRQ